MPRKKLSRNAPCPCGSGKKYKHCCYRDGVPFGGTIPPRSQVQSTPSAPWRCMVPTTREPPRSPLA